MIEGVGRAIGTVTKRLGAAIIDAGGEIVRRYHGTRAGAGVDMSTKNEVDVRGAGDIDEPNRDARPSAAGGGDRVAGSPAHLMSVDEFTARFLAADRSGDPVIR
ncbi:hypothetical protein ACWCPQ_29070 [Nocardia sp. NPDC001965]